MGEPNTAVPIRITHTEQYLKSELYCEFSKFMKIHKLNKMKQNSIQTPKPQAS